MYNIHNFKLEEKSTVKNKGKSLINRRIANNKSFYFMFGMLTFLTVTYSSVFVLIIQTSKFRGFTIFGLSMLYVMVYLFKIFLHDQVLQKIKSLKNINPRLTSYQIEDVTIFKSTKHIVLCALIISFIYVAVSYLFASSTIALILVLILLINLLLFDIRLKWRFLKQDVFIDTSRLEVSDNLEEEEDDDEYKYTSDRDDHGNLTS